MEIEIFADVVCPWCYLGKTRLEAALAPVDAEVVLRWRPFQLDPNLPYQGQPLLPWLAARFGGADRARQAMTQVTAAARSDGLVLDLDRALIANTFDAHRLIWFADQPQAVVFGAGPDTQMELVEALHRAHFTDGRDISTMEVLTSVAVSVGLDRDRIARLLRSTEGVADVRGQLAHAHDLGITAVPTFVFAGKYAVSGARDVDTLRSLLVEVFRREGMATTAADLIPSQRRTAIRDDDSQVA